MTQPHGHAGTAPFFIMGCRRTGTTLVSQILDSHSRLASYHESYFYNIFRPELRWYGDLARPRNMDRLLRDAREIIAMQRVTPPGLEELRAAVASTPTFEGVLAALLRLYAEGRGKVRGGDKTPEHHEYLDEILEEFPDSPVFYLMRDPRDTALSSVKSFGVSPADAAWAWNAALESYRRARRPVRLVRYEELVQDPVEHVKGLCAVLGEAYEESMMAFFEHLPDHFRNRPAGKKLERPVDASSIGNFRQMAAHDIWTIESICGEGMEAEGYAFVGARPPRARPQQRVRRPFVAEMLGRLRYYGMNGERWRRGFARWRLMLRVRARHVLGAAPFPGSR
ncbi:MAG: sulfotransferase [Gemmatimonadetes bacterium]|nr:sulfotransferase [Gemmatimonadota bacterium]